MPICLTLFRNDLVIARQPNEPDNIIGKRITAVVSGGPALECSSVWAHCLVYVRVGRCGVLC